jgi:hypothetical protein
MLPLIEWPALLGAGVALVVGVLAFFIAGGLVDGRAGDDRDRSDQGGMRPAS